MILILLAFSKKNVLGPLHLSHRRFCDLQGIHKEEVPKRTIDAMPRADPFTTLYLVTALVMMTAKAVDALHSANPPLAIPNARLRGGSPSRVHDAWDDRASSRLVYALRARYDRPITLFASAGSGLTIPSQATSVRNVFVCCSDGGASRQEPASRGHRQDERAWRF